MYTYSFEMRKAWNGILWKKNKNLVLKEKYSKYFFSKDTRKKSQTLSFHILAEYSSEHS